MQFSSYFEFQNLFTLFYGASLKSAKPRTINIFTLKQIFFPHIIPVSVSNISNYSKQQTANNGRVASL